MIGFCPTSNASAVFFATLCSGNKLQNKKIFLIQYFQEQRNFSKQPALTISYSFYFEPHSYYYNYKLICEKKKKVYGMGRV
jgi:hypothetical protein